MALLIALATVLILLGGFILLTSFERKRGTRFLAPLRARLDVYVQHTVQTLRSIDTDALAYVKVKAAAVHLVHEIAHQVLLMVRALERTLTGAVRALRRKKEAASLQDSQEKIG